MSAAASAQVPTNAGDGRPAWWSSAGLKGRMLTMIYYKSLYEQSHTPAHARKPTLSPHLTSLTHPHTYTHTHTRILHLADRAVLDTLSVTPHLARFIIHFPSRKWEIL